jgi:6-phosphogluconate dehydrogenase
MVEGCSVVAKAVEGVKLELMAEAYSTLKSSIRISHDEMRMVFADWNRGELADPLVASAADVLGLRDEDGDPLLEKVLDISRGPELCGPAASLALDLSCPAPMISQAAFSAFLSGMKDQRVDASAVLSGPKSAPSGEHQSLIEELRKALVAALVICYAESYALLFAAGVEKDTAVSGLSEDGAVIATLAAEARSRGGAKESILLDALVKSRIDPCLGSLRRLCARSAEAGLPCPGFSAALSFYDGYRSTWLPSNMVVALRDGREGTGYERIDRPRGDSFHSDWR